MGILDNFRLDGKTALVTGANRGLGQAIAIGLAEAGANVIGLSRSSDGSTAAAIEPTGQSYQHAPFNLLEVSIEEVRDLVNTLPQIDILVNNAGITSRGAYLDFTEEDWDTVLQVNLKAVFFLSQAVARKMKERETGGKIIHVASVLSYQGGIRVPAYTASKHGLLGLTVAMANELAPHRINVNGIAPGYMSTDMTAILRADHDRNPAILARIPAGDWGDPADLQGAAVYLASAASDYVHGTTIPVDGGWLAR